MKRVLESKIGTIVLLAILVVVLSALFKLYSEKTESEKKVADLETKAEEIRSENEELQARSDYFKSMAFLEKEAREQFNYKMPDEEVAFVYQDDEKGEESPAGPASNIRRGNFLTRFLYKLFTRD